MKDESTAVRFVRAREQSLEDINQLIARSRAHWRWPEGYLEAALPWHQIDSAYLRNHHCFEAVDSQVRLVAFFSIVAGERVVLDNLWVTPELIGSGIGRLACLHVLRLAHEQGWTDLWVMPDPPAEGFYRKMGFTDTGERVPSRVPNGPVFHVYHMRPGNHRQL
jgi:GNAT superfamily N-acetyltransferase